MIEIPAYPGEAWQPVICRVCKHPFAVLIADPAMEPVVLCQACSWLVDVLGKPAAPKPAPQPIPPPSQQPALPAAPTSLSSVWADWWSRWQESQQEASLPGGASPEAEASC